MVEFFVATKLVELIPSVIVSSIQTSAFGRGNKVRENTFEDLFDKALKKTIKELNPKFIKEIKNKLKNSKAIHKEIERYKYEGKLIDISIIEGIFKDTLGEGHSEFLIKNFFYTLSKLIAANEQLAHHIQLINLDYLLKYSQKLSDENQEIKNLLLEVIKQINIEEKKVTLLEWQNIPEEPVNFVEPIEIQNEINSKFENGNLFLFGNPGTGKSVNASLIASKAIKEEKSVFWYKFSEMTIEQKTFEDSLIYFL